MSSIEVWSQNWSQSVGSQAAVDFIINSVLGCIYFHHLSELRQSDLEVTARHLNEVEAVQHVHLTNIPIWFGLLGDIYDGCMQDRCTRPVVSAYAAWHQMVPICTEWLCTEANEAIQTHCYNPVAPAYPIWAYYAHGRQRRCQEDPVSLPSGRLEKTTRSSPHHVVQHRPTGSETTTLRSLKQQIWLRTTLCGGWCRRMELCNRKSCMPETTTTSWLPSPLQSITTLWLVLNYTVCDRVWTACPQSLHYSSTARSLSHNLLIAVLMP